MRLYIMYSGARFALLRDGLLHGRDWQFFVGKVLPIRVKYVQPALLAYFTVEISANSGDRSGTGPMRGSRYLFV